MNRRDFIKWVSKLAGVAVVAPKVVKPFDPAAYPPGVPVPEEQLVPVMGGLVSQYTTAAAFIYGNNSGAFLKAIQDAADSRYVRKDAL